MHAGQFVELAGEGSGRRSVGVDDRAADREHKRRTNTRGDADLLEEAKAILRGYPTAVEARH
ncbi:hypothetical protein [Streptomyces coacervatus]|uniref:hypothetical protein n=1 Tax=Streptomyces coacervatus TaxID=647381 RepID=UPI0030B848C2